MIHAGIYYPQNSLKSLLCVRGRKLLYDYCENYNIDYKNTRKLVVATSLAQYQSNLPSIKKSGEDCGVTSLTILSRDDVKYLEPEVECYGALLSPETGVLNSHEYMISLLGEAENHGAVLALNTKVDCVSSDLNGFTVQSDGIDLKCDILINGAGLFAGHIAFQLFHNMSTLNSVQSINPSNSINRQYFAKGNYYRLVNQKNPFHHLIYPIPEKGGLGVHATIDLGGNCRFGPDVEWIDPSITDPDNIALNVDPTRANEFYEQVRKYWPNLKDGNLAPDYAGIRPKLGHPDHSGKGMYADFLIEGEKNHGIKGFVNLMGIESPGLTSSLAIAEKVVQLLSLQ